MGSYFSVLSYKYICCWTCICIWYITSRTTFGPNNKLLDNVMTFISAVNLVLSFKVWWSLNPLLSRVPNKRLNKSHYKTVTDLRVVFRGLQDPSFLAIYVAKYIQCGDLLVMANGGTESTCVASWFDSFLVYHIKLSRCLWCSKRKFYKFIIMDLLAI